MSIIYKLLEPNGLRKGQSCMEDNFTIWQITEKGWEFNPETHIPFIDYENGFERINRTIL